MLGSLPTWPPFACPKRSIHQRSGPVQRIRPLVHILVESDRRRGVPKGQLHRLDARPGMDQQHRIVVPRAVEAPPHRQAHLGSHRRPGAREGRRKDRATIGIPKHERGRPTPRSSWVGVVIDQSLFRQASDRRHYQRADGRLSSLTYVRKRSILLLFFLSCSIQRSPSPFKCFWMEKSPVFQ